MDTKIISIMAVLVMAFAGFGGVIASEANDAASNSEGGKLTLSYEGMLDPAVVEVLLPYTTADTTITYTAFWNGVEPTYQDMDAFETYIKPFMKGEGITIPYEVVKFIFANKATKDAMVTDTPVFDAKVVAALEDYYDIEPTAEGKIDTASKEYKAVAKYNSDDMVAALEKFADVDAIGGEIVDGVATHVVIVSDSLPGDFEYDVLDVEDAEAAVIAAIAATEAKYEGWMSPADFDKAVQAIKDSYKDWKSPADVEKIVEAAIQEYIKTHPTGGDTTVWMTVAIVFIVATLALGGLVAYGEMKKAKAKKMQRSA